MEEKGRIRRTMGQREESLLLDEWKGGEGLENWWKQGEESTIYV